MNSDYWVARLADELAKPLPGVEAQLRLSPPGRIPVALGKSGKVSAVLIVLYEHEDKIFTIFIKRAEYNGVHSGQVSLPGGIYEKEDGILERTALRETREETGIAEEKIKVIGALTSLQIPVSGTTVYPFVGYCTDKPKFIPDPIEVKYIIEASLEELLDPLNQKSKKMLIGDKEIEIPYFDIREDHIWGATAMIMSEFLEVFRKIKN